MKKAGFILIIVILLLIINGLFHSIYDLWQKQDLLTSAQNELDAQRLKNSKLKADLSYVQSQQFIDEEARNKLFLAKPGEKDVIIPNNITVGDKKSQNSDNIPNWQKWLNLLF